MFTHCEDLFLVVCFLFCLLCYCFCVLFMCEWTLQFPVMGWTKYSVFCKCPFNPAGRSKYITGSKERYLLGQNTCTFLGLSPLSSYEATSKQQLNGERQWKMRWKAKPKSLHLQEGAGPAAVEAWRLFNSVAGRAAYVASLCESLQDLTVLALDYRQYSGDPNHLLEDEEEGTPGYNSVDSKGDRPVRASKSPSVLENTAPKRVPFGSHMRSNCPKVRKFQVLY